MIKNKLVSILIPLYNAEKFVAQTLNSCLSQTYQNIEIIIVDDGSTDESFKIAKAYEKQYKNIKVFEQKNSGASSARNKAFSLSSGEYIQYLDADDILDKDKILLQIKTLETEDDTTLVFGKWGTFESNIEYVTWQYPPVNKDYDDSKRFLLDLWSSGMTVVIYSWLVSRILVESSTGWDEAISTNDDGEFFARIVMESEKVLFVNNSIGYYRKGNLYSLSNQVSKKALISNLKSFETYMKLMEDSMDEAKVKRCLGLVYSKFLYKIPTKYGDLIKETKSSIHDLGYTKPIYRLQGYEHLLSYVLGIRNVLQLKKVIKKLVDK